MALNFILLPLYIYPYPLSTWDPLFNVAKSYPNVTFKAVINPDTGPGGDDCPNSDYTAAMAQLNGIPNIQTLAYVHTAAQWDCGPDANGICPCTQPLSALEANITKYQNWNIEGKCSDQDIHVDGIFFDESPDNANCTSYMSDATAFAKSTLSKGNTVLFNAGTSVDPAYWPIPDYINTFENTEAAYDSADIGALDGEGAYHAQNTLIMYSYTDGTGKTLQRDVDTILSSQRDAMAGLYITDKDGYTEFPSAEFLDAFVSNVQTIVEANEAAS